MAWVGPPRRLRHTDPAHKIAEAARAQDLREKENDQAASEASGAMTLEMARRRGRLSQLTSVQ